MNKPIHRSFDWSNRIPIPYTLTPLPLSHSNPPHDTILKGDASSLTRLTKLQPSIGFRINRNQVTGTHIHCINSFNHVRINIQLLWHANHILSHVQVTLSIQ